MRWKAIVTSNDKKYWDVGLSRAVVEVDAADDNHADRDDHGDTAGNGAADGAEQEENDLYHEVYDIPRGLVSVPDPAEQRVVGGRFSCRNSGQTGYQSLEDKTHR